MSDETKPKPIANIEFLGKTYDVVTMDPTTLAGTTKNHNIFDWTEWDPQATSAGGYSVPKGVSSTPIDSTTYLAQTQAISSVYEFQAAAKTDVSIEAGVPGVFEFSASAGFSNMHSLTQTRKWSYAYGR